MQRKIFNAMVLASVSSAVLSQAAHATAFQVRENSAEGVSMVFAGDGSRADDLATIFNNPAGMSNMPGTQAEFGAIELFPSIRFHGESSIGGSPLPGDNGGNGGKPATIPSMYGKFDYNDRLSFGVALTVPFGNVVNYDTTSAWSGRYVGVKTAAISANINPSVAYKVTDSFSIGAGVSAQYFKLDVTSAIPDFLIFGAGTPDGGYRLRGDSWAYGYDFGVLWDVDNATRIGASYRSQMDQRVEGTLHFTNFPLGVNSHAHANLDLPGTIDLSVTHDLTPDFSLSSEVQLDQWSSFRKVEVISANAPFTFEEHYRDSWLISLGGIYRVAPQWKLRFGAGWDQTPVVDAFRGVGVPDTDHYILGIGAGYDFSDQTSIDLGYAHHFALDHPTMNKSFSNTDPFTGAVVLNGSYTNHLDYVGLTLKHKY